MEAMFSKFMFWIIALPLGVVATFPGAVQAAGSGTFTIGTFTDVNVGDVVTVPVSFSSLSMPKTLGLDGQFLANYQSQLVISYAPQDLAFVTASQYSILNQSIGNPNNLPVSVAASTGIITVFPLAYLNRVHPPASGDIMAISFKVLRRTATTVSWVPSLTHFSYTYANAPVEWNPISLTLRNGQIATKPVAAPPSPQTQPVTQHPSTVAPPVSQPSVTAEASRPLMVAPDQRQDPEPTALPPAEASAAAQPEPIADEGAATVQAATDRLGNFSIGLMVGLIPLGVLGGMGLAYRDRLLARWRTRTS
jgi:hypothetical protein